MKEPCFHCGDEIIGKGYFLDEKVFCCNGCRSVYQLLKDNNLGDFYSFETNAGVKPSKESEHKYAFLDVDSIRQKFIDFEEGELTRITLFLPEIHCSSCIYLLENLPKIQEGVTGCHINFSKREAVISFYHKQLPLSELALFLSKIGYPPNFGNRDQSEKKIDKIFMYKIGIAAFAFGSIMLWSVPDYAGVGDANPVFRTFTSYLSFAVSIPVLLFSAKDYFISAYKALRYKSLNLDVPITLGIIALYLQSVYSILKGEGAGYMDSFAGFIFFLLIGKWFQNKTYKSMSFERDYTAYFPVAITKMNQGEETIVEIEHLNVGDIMLIRNEEVVPCDSILVSDTAKIDYSFVTGESKPIYKNKGDFIYAGGRLVGQRVQMSVHKESNRSHLTQMWNEVKSNKETITRFAFQDKISRYFLVIILIIAVLASIAWAFFDPSRITQIVVAILIVACPCALALSAPFTYGNIMRVLGRKGLFLKNTAVIERLNSITDVVFDKTGTLTSSAGLEVEYVGDFLTEEEKEMICAISNSSTHPLSRAIVTYFKSAGIFAEHEINAFEEVSGKGVSGQMNGKIVQVGSASYTGSQHVDANESASYIRVNGKVGKFIFTSQLRARMDEMMRSLSNYKIHILSGDKDKDRELMLKILPDNSSLIFEQTPKDKLNYILALKEQGKSVMMIGDGLNDSGALGAANVGIAVSEDVFRFSPSSDAIIEAEKLWDLNGFMKTSAYSKTILTACLMFSLSYNVIGLSFAISGNLTPLVAAILMPISSITVVFISSFMSFLKK
jgi:Cu+-exporting ATPase